MATSKELNLTTDKEGKLGSFRQFDFSEAKYEIVEILNEPDIKMKWTWDTGLCPHCKKRITQTIDHEFYRIEILKEVGVKSPTTNNLLLLGDTIDGRKMMFPGDKKEQILKDKSKKYKSLFGGKE